MTVTRSTDSTTRSSLDSLVDAAYMADPADRLIARVSDHTYSTLFRLVPSTLALLQTAAARGVDLIGSTVVVLVRDTDFTLCGWVGDSRAYCYEDDRLSQITRDHVHGGDVDVTHFGAAPPPAAGSGVLTRAVGAEEQLFVDWVVAGSRPGTSFVLCSDGINKEMSDSELHEQCRAHPQPEDLVESLFELALGRAGRDNISAVVVGLQA